MSRARARTATGITRTRPPPRRRRHRRQKPQTYTFWILLALLLLELLAAVIDPQSGLLRFPKWTSIVKDKRVLKNQRDDDQYPNPEPLFPHLLEANVTESIMTANLRTTEIQLHDATTAATQAVDYRENFSGIVPRSFGAWPENQTLPCFPPDKSVVWALQKTKGRGKNNRTKDDVAKQGFFFLKPFKTGSSTAAGVNLRISRNVAIRQRRRLLQGYKQEQRIQPHEFCNSRFDHGGWQRPGLKFANRDRENRSFLWTIIRHPTKRLVSMFFHFQVSRQKQEPKDAVFQAFLKNDRSKHQDYYIRALDTRSNVTSPKGKGPKKNPVATANHIFQDYDFIAVTERMDESFVALMMILHLPMSDILYLSAKRKGGYDAGSIGKNGKCTYIWPSFVTSGMEDYFASDQHQEMVKNDLAFYQAVNQSLDMTIDRLGRIEFEKNLAKYRTASALIQERCAPNAVMPCTQAGKFVEHNKTDCLWKDSGCATTCLDEVAQELAIE